MAFEARHVVTIAGATENAHDLILETLPRLFERFYQRPILGPRRRFAQRQCRLGRRKVLS
jgi:hypothetical protein